MRLILDSEGTVELDGAPKGGTSADKVMDTLLLGTVGMIKFISGRMGADPDAVRDTFINNLRHMKVQVVDAAEFEAAIEDLCKGAVDRDD